MMNIKKIIKEEINDFEWVSDVEPMEPAMEYLKDNFNNLERVRSGLYQAYYVDSGRKPFIMYYPNEDTGSVWVNTQRIWTVLKKDFGLKYRESQELIKKWLEEDYNLKGLTPTRWDSSFCHSWKKPID